MDLLFLLLRLPLLEELELPLPPKEISIFAIPTNSIVVHSTLMKQNIITGKNQHVCTVLNVSVLADH